MKIRAGDSVVITTGKDKGKTGKVLRVLETKNRVVVTDANMRTRHIKGGPNRPGEIVKYEASIALSNVMIIDPKTKKRSRVGFKKNAKGHKVRIAKISGEEIKKGTVAAKKETTAKSDGTKVKTVKSDTKKETKKDAPASNDPKSPFWKKMGFGAEDMVNEGTAEGKAEDAATQKKDKSSAQSSSRGK